MFPGFVLPTWVDFPDLRNAAALHRRTKLRLSVVAAKLAG
jgi:hypothetical protein